MEKMELKIIPNFPAYCISKNGKVWSSKRKQFLKLNLYGGYPYAALQKDSKAYRKQVHRLVLETFVGPCPEGMECCHDNGIRTDNRLENLRWDTRKNNHKDAMRHGTHPCLHREGEASPNAKLKEKDVRMIIYMYRTGLFLQREIAKVYNVSRTTIENIIIRKKWKHIWSDSRTKSI